MTVALFPVSFLNALHVIYDSPFYCDYGCEAPVNLPDRPCGRDVHAHCRLHADAAVNPVLIKSQSAVAPMFRIFACLLNMVNMVQLDLGLSVCDFLFNVAVKTFVSNPLSSPGAVVTVRPDSGLLIDVMVMIVAEALKYHIIFFRYSCYFSKSQAACIYADTKVQNLLKF